MTKQILPPQADAEPETLSVGDSLFEIWFSEHNPAHKGTKQQMRDAYAAGMGDPLVKTQVQAKEYKPNGDEDFVRRMSVLCVSCGDPYGMHFGYVCPNERTTFVAKEAA